MLSNEPLVSVCIPAYNHEKYIVDCLGSVMAQTYQNIELIIIDDGSRDRTKQKILDMMPKLESRFVRVFFESQTNQGTCRTINKLYKIARGKYIYHIASDDMTKPNAVKTQVAFLEQNPGYALVVGDNEIIDGDGKRAYWNAERNNVYDKKHAIYKTFGDFLRKTNADIDFNSELFGTYATLFNRNYIPNGYLIRRDILEKTGPFTPDAPLEDWWFMMQISKYAKIKYIDTVLFSYRWHGANTMTQTAKVQAIANKTAVYEWQLLKKINFSETRPDVRKVFLRERRRRFVHRFIYHRSRVGNVVTIKLFGFIRLSFRKKDSH